jgi:hypothetical protein
MGIAGSYNYLWRPIASPTCRMRLNSCLRQHLAPLGLPHDSHDETRRQALGPVGQPIPGPGAVWQRNRQPSLGAGEEVLGRRCWEVTASGARTLPGCDKRKEGRVSGSRQRESRPLFD